jgi:hypothetical protein
MLEHPELGSLRRWMLITQDAQAFYQQHGFALQAGGSATLDVMEKIFPDVYRHSS